MRPRGAFVVCLLVACGARTALSTNAPQDAATYDASLDAHDEGPIDDAGPDAVVDAPFAITPAIGVAYESCALPASGVPKCWGAAPIGDGTENAATVAEPIATFDAAVAELGLMANDACVRLVDGRVQCWGRANHMELGLGLFTGDLADDAGNLTLPTTVATLAPATALFAGSDGACSVGTNGAVACWGLELSNYQTGYPAPVTGFAAPVREIAFSMNSRCAALVDGRVQCWGANNEGTLGLGSLDPSFLLTPGATVVGLSSAIGIAAGDVHACALLATGGVVCWGRGNEGALGDGEIYDADVVIAQAAPVPVQGLSSGVRAIRAGGQTTCALLATGAVKCWGRALGVPFATSKQFVPVDVPGIADAIDLAVSSSRACVLLASGAARCWGNRPLGDGTDAGSAVPVDVVGLP